MKVVIVGCGGIGGVLAASLTRAGIDVTPVVGNAEVARAVQTHGLRIRELDGQEWSVPASRTPVLALTDDHGPFDLAIAATQNTTLDKALTAVAPHLMPDAAVVTIQNGLPEERARKIVGDRVIGCVVGWGATQIEPGLYQRTSKGVLTFGRPTAGGPAPEPIATLCEPVSPSVVTDDLAGVRWSKLAINCVTSAMGAVSGLPLGKMLAHRFARRIALEVFAEVHAVAQASRIKVQPVGGTLDIAKLAITDAERGLSIGSPSLAYKHSVLLAVGLKYRRMRSSMLYALERGRQPEIDFLNGEIVSRGAALGVPTPVNAALVEQVRAIARTEAWSEVAGLRAIYDQIVVGRARERQAA